MQTVFPTVYSTLDPAALATYIGRQYQLQDVLCQFLVRGVGDTYRVQARNARYILRIYRPSHRTQGNIAAEAELLLALHAAGVPVSYPLADKDGQYLQALPAAEGTRYAMLFSFAEGHAVNLLSPNQLQVLGTQMARFHNVSATLQLSDPRWAFDLDTTLFIPLANARDHFGEDAAGYAWLQQAAREVQGHLAVMDTAAFASGYCHFDLLPKNFHFDEKDHLTFFDFDFFGRGWLIQDIMTFRQQLLLDRLMGRLTAEQFTAAYDQFISAYTAVRPLGDEALKAIPWLGLGFWMFYMGFHMTHDQFYTLMQSHVLQSRTAFIRKIVEMDRA
ncbi:hypothetical protein DCC81_06215 [Chitinophaga parva]|uniref:Aminoglycoside phosphotransferase domain-containing protein n=1 Tax=Chitinophaga parva TaxID=2169414 RepID=A0A2T7BN64_9BACT|nr:phosphotransferase [Chitinophaga parva]PUZ29061.1 hypothetical protein DCC81_06215 [Chitinophaga parva]